MPTCPKGGKNPHRAYSVWAETTSPVTHRSTKVALPYVMCATLEAKAVSLGDGKVKYQGTFSVGAGQHGLVALDASTWAVGRRQALRATVKAHPERAVRRVAAPPKDGRKRAEKAAPAHPTPRKGSTPPPAPKTRPAARAAPPRASKKAVREAALKVAAATDDPNANVELTEAGKALLASAGKSTGSA
jgi:hypothetical protein